MHRSLDFAAKRINQDESKTSPIHFSVLSQEDFSPNENSDATLVFGYDSAAGVEQWEYSWSSRRIRLTREDFRQAGQYTANLVSHRMARSQDRSPQKMKPQQIQITQQFQYLVLPYGAELETEDWEEGEVEEEESEAGMARRKLVLAEEVETSNGNSLSALSEA